MSEQASERTPRYRLERGHVRHRLIHELARGEKSRADLAREFKVVRSAITDFARRHQVEIDQVRQDLENEFSGLWIARKAARLAELESDVERIDAALAALQNGSEDDDGDDEERPAPATLTSLLRAKKDALRAVAEELGQLPTRNTVAVAPVTVRHEIVGVDPEDLS